MSDLVVGRVYNVAINNGTCIYTGELLKHNLDEDTITIKDFIDGAHVSFKLWMLGDDDIWEDN